MITPRAPKWVVPVDPSTWKETGRTELGPGELFQLWQVPKPKDPTRMYYQLWVWDEAHRSKQYLTSSLVDSVRYLFAYSHVPGTEKLLEQVLFLLQEREQED